MPGSCWQRALAWQAPGELLRGVYLSLPWLQPVARRLGVLRRRRVRGRYA